VNSLTVPFEVHWYTYFIPINPSAHPPNGRSRGFNFLCGFLFL
jgi:hypothetical protein